MSVSTISTVVTSGYVGGTSTISLVALRGFSPSVGSVVLSADGVVFTLVIGDVKPPIASKASQRPVLERVPEMTAKVSDRARRFTEKLSVMVNSLFAQRYIVLEGPASYSIRSGAWVHARAPLATDDFSQGIQVGNIWVDTLTSKAYICVDNSSLAAIWNGPI